VGAVDVDAIAEDMGLAVRDVFPAGKKRIKDLGFHEGDLPSNQFNISFQSI